MSKQHITRITVVGAICALVSVPSALGGSAYSCPESAGQGCEQIGTRSGDVRTGAKKQQKPQQVRLAPRAGFDGRGQQAWRAGNHLMQ